MSPRIIHIPLSGGDRKAQAKGIRYAHGIHETYFRESVLIRSAAEAKNVDGLACLKQRLPSVSLAPSTLRYL
jgi:hypothetical protein